MHHNTEDGQDQHPADQENSTGRSIDADDKTPSTEASPPAEQLQTNNPKPVTDNMEVHHHTHHPKKWKEYFWEFFMLFLAVFCGFLAEIQVEHYVEHQRENEYLHSFISDLKKDTLAINEALKDKRIQIERADTVINMLSSSSYLDRLNDLYYYCRILGFRNFFRQNDGTLQQLRNAGGLRLIRNSRVTDKIRDYTKRLLAMEDLQELEEAQIVDYRHSMSRIFNAFVFNSMYVRSDTALIKKPSNNPMLLSNDKFDINDLAIKLVFVKGNRISQLNSLQRLKKSAKETIELINKEYAFD